MNLKGIQLHFIEFSLNYWMNRSFGQTLIKVLCIYSILLIFPRGSMAQDGERPIELPAYLKVLENTYSVKFSYDPEKLAGIFIDQNLFDSLSLEEAVILLENNTRLDFQQATNSTWLIIPEHSENSQTGCLQFLDAETLEPVSGLVLQSGSEYLNGNSDENGKFKILDGLEQFDTLRCRFFGYKDQFIVVARLEQADCPVIKLEPEIAFLDEIVITGYLAPGINSLVNDHSLQIKPKELSLLPGQTSGDILQSLSTLPGINSPNTKAGNLFMRGSTPDQTFVLVDNIPLYNKGHYFGTISPFNQQVIEDIKVYRGGSHPRTGGRIGGTIEMRTEEKVADSLEASLGMSMTNAMGYVHAPLLKDKLSMLVSGRYSLPSSWNTPRQKSLEDFVNQDDIFLINQNRDSQLKEKSYQFADFNSKVIYEISDSSKITASFLHTESKEIERSENNAENTSKDSEISGHNDGVNLEWQYQWSKRVKTAIFATWSNYQNLTYHFTYNRENNDTVSFKYFNPDIQNVTLRSESQIKMKNNVNSIDVGYNLEYNRNELAIREIANGRPNLGQLNLQEAFTHSLYANYNLRSPEKLGLNLGLRSSYYTLTKNIYLEPRLFANYQIHKFFSLKGSYGWFHQYIQQLIFFDFNDTKPENFNWGLSSTQRPPVRSRQAVLGFLLHNKSWTVDVEAYDKIISPIHTSGGLTPQGVLMFEGQGHMNGLDLLVKKSFKNINTWLSYSLGKVTWEFDTLSNDEVYAYYDQRHTLNLGVIYQKGNWSVSSAWKLVSGVPDQKAVVFIPPPPPGRPPGPAPKREITYNGRFPWHHQMDLSLAYKISPKRHGWNAHVSLSAFNVYNKQTLLQIGEEHGTKYEVYTMGFSPNAQVVVNF